MALQQWSCVQELVDLTIDFLHGSTKDLKRCALVSHSWLPAARYHLFSYVSLQAGGPIPQHLLDMFSTDQYDHIRRVITHLAIEGTPTRGGYDITSQMYSSHLKQLSIYTLPSPETFPILQDLLALPNLSHISILQTEDSKLLCSFFLKRTANLGTLRVSSRVYRGELGGLAPITTDVPLFQLDCLHMSVFLERASVEVFNLAAVTRLIIDDCAELSSFAAIMQDFNSLTYFEITAHTSDRPGSAAFMKNADIQLHTLPRLEHFILHIDLPSTLAAIPILLSGLEPSASLKQVTLIVSRDCAASSMDLSTFSYSQYWSAIDECLARLEVSLTVRVNLCYGGALESPAGVEELRGCLPLLSSTRRLLVTAFT
ncbi:hypothetical protein C8R46DRAFT_1216735 [Mycena filopes]|nr:hypothetical protein C8R46DRAFT_1216735 [Mycena filopes]